MDLFTYAPGLAVAQGMNVGFNSVGQSIQNDRMRQVVDEWNANENLRNLQRRGLEQQTATMNELNQDAFDHLNALRGKQGALLSGVPTAYMDVLNTTQPLPQGMTRRLSSDQKTIEIVDPTGQVRGTTPNLTGQAAYDAVLMRGQNLAAQAAGIRDQQMKEAELANRLALAQLDFQGRLALAGMRGAGGGSGGSGGKGGSDPFKAGNFNLDEFAKLGDMGIRLVGDPNIPVDENGKIKTDNLTPEQYQSLQQMRLDFSNRAARIMLNNAGMPPAIAALVAADEIKRERHLGNVNNLALGQLDAVMKLGKRARSLTPSVSTPAPSVGYETGVDGWYTPPRGTGIFGNLWRDFQTGAQQRNAENAARVKARDKNKKQ